MRVRDSRIELLLERKREQGVSMIAVLVALVALIGASGLAIDVGIIWTARTQLQNTADAAALAAASNMIVAQPPSVTLGLAETAGISVAGQNKAPGAPSVTVNAADINFGEWDLSNSTFDTSVDLGNPDLVTAADVVARLESGTNQPVPAFMSRVLGRTSFPVQAQATAYLGFAGSVEPGEIDLPIVIDCCKLRGDACAGTYCPLDPLPNPCSLATPQTGDGDVTCLNFESTPAQNACWTVFDGDRPSINTPDLSTIVEEGNAVKLTAEEYWYLDNGDKTPLFTDIKERFQVEGSNIYPGSNDPAPDSWVVALPVVECQTDVHCAGGGPSEVKGFVCFEVREVSSPPDEKVIRGRFLCPTDDLFSECDLGTTGTGGDDFGIRADIPVLVR